MQNLRSMCAKACEQFIAGMGWPYDLQNDRPLGHSEVLIVLFPQNIQNIPKLSSKLANLSLVTSYHKVALCHSILHKYCKNTTKWINHLSNISFLIAKSCYILLILFQQETNSAHGKSTAFSTAVRRGPSRSAWVPTSVTTEPIDFKKLWKLLGIREIDRSTIIYDDRLLDGNIYIFNFFRTFQN